MLQVAAAPEALVNVRPASAATAPQQARINSLRTQRGIGAIRIGKVNVESLRASRVGQTLSFQVEEDRAVKARVVSLETQNGLTVWRGEVPGVGARPPGVATMVVTGAGVTGTIHADNGKTYSLRPLPGGETAIAELDYATMPLDEPEAMTGDFNKSVAAAATLRPIASAAVTKPAPRLANRQMVRPVPVAAVRSPLTDIEVSRRLKIDPELLRKATEPSEISISERFRLHPRLIEILVPPTINVLVAYTPAAATQSGDITGLINLAIAETNGSFVNSNVWSRVRLAGTVAVSYSETGRSYDTIMQDLVTNGDGKMDAVFTQRAATRADVVVLVMNQGDWCGMATTIQASADNAFAVVHWPCATGYYSFAHEIGHLLGTRHDPPTDGSSTPFAYGHGKRHAASSNGWRTIMGYACPGNQCDPRLQYWSSPLTTWNGMAMGSAGLEDNRRVWNERTPVVAGFR
ncbi:MAG: M12 family metallo-peptidase, partial [Novosphingobium sp.]